MFCIWYMHMLNLTKSKRTYLAFFFFFNREKFHLKTLKELLKNLVKI